MVRLSSGPHDVGFVVMFPSLEGYLDKTGSDGIVAAIEPSRDGGSVAKIVALADFFF